MIDKEKRINEIAKDMCFYKDCKVGAEGRCHELNCEITWDAERLVDLNYQKVDKDSVVLTKTEKEKLLHEMYEQGRFDALADLDKNGKVVLSHDEFCSMIKTDKEATEYGQQCWNNGKTQGIQETAKDILNGLECFFWETAINDTKNFDLCQSLYRSIKEHIKNKYGVTKEN